MAIIRKLHRIGQAAGRHPHGLPCVRHPRQGAAGPCRMEDVRSRRAGRPLHRPPRQRPHPEIERAPGDKTHPILAGVSTPFPARARSTRPVRWRPRPLPLLMGKIPGNAGRARRLGQCTKARRGSSTRRSAIPAISSARVPPPAQQRHLLGSRPPATAASQGPRQRRPRP